MTPLAVGKHPQFRFPTRHLPQAIIDATRQQAPVGCTRPGNPLTRGLAQW